jgi:hypothetical protein
MSDQLTFGRPFISWLYSWAWSEESYLRRERAIRWPDGMTKRFPVRSFKPSPEIIHAAEMLFLSSALSLRSPEDLLNERGTEIGGESL